MNGLLESLELLNNISDFNNVNEVKEIALKAFSNCPLCLEAASIYAKTLTSEEDKFTFLKKAVDDAQKDIEESDTVDANTMYSLMRGYFEYGVMAYSFGKYKESLFYFERLKEMDEKDDYKAGYRLLSLYAYFELNEKFDELYSQLCADTDDYSKLKRDFPKMLIAYKANDFETVKKTIKDIKEDNPYILKIMKEEISEDVENMEIKESLTVLRNNAFIINGCMNIIAYIRGLDD